MKKEKKILHFLHILENIDVFEIIIHQPFMNLLNYKHAHLQTLNTQNVKPCSGSVLCFFSVHKYDFGMFWIGLLNR